LDKQPARRNIPVEDARSDKGHVLEIDSVRLVRYAVSDEAL
jgi:hypothetical protein